MEQTREGNGENGKMNGEMNREIWSDFFLHVILPTIMSMDENTNEK